MKSLWKRTLVSMVVSAVAVCSVASYPVSAYNLTTSQKKFAVSDLTNIRIFMPDPNYWSNYGLATMHGAGDWNRGNVTVGFSITNSYLQRQVYCYQYSDSDGILAETFFYRRVSTDMIAEVKPFDSTNTYNWDLCTIKVNNYYSVDYTTLCHEFGHVFGFAHSNDDPTSIMCQTYFGRTATYPSDDDLLGLEYLYS